MTGPVARIDSPERSPPPARSGAGRMLAMLQPMRSPRTRTSTLGMRTRERTMVDRLLSAAIRSVDAADREPTPGRGRHFATDRRERPAQPPLAHETTGHAVEIGR